MKMQAKKTYNLIFAIFILALLPRLFIAFSSQRVPAYDSVSYDSRAMFLVTGEGFGTTSAKDPFYSIFLAGIYYLFGHSYLAVRFIQAVLGALTCVFIFLIAKKVCNIKIALAAGILASANPAFIKSGEYVLTENLFAFLLVTAIFFLTGYMRGRRQKDLIFAGLFIGIAALTRSVLILFPAFLSLIFTREFKDKRGIGKNIYAFFTLLLFFVIPIAPWTARNWHVHHKFVPISTSTGLGLYSSYLPKDGKLFGFTSRDEVVIKSEELGSETKQSEFLAKETFKYIKNNPLTVLKLEVLKTFYFWAPFDWEIIGGGRYNYIYGFIFPFFLYGLFVALRSFPELIIVYLPVCYGFLMALLTYGSPRFRMPFEPYIIIIAAAGFFILMDKFRKKAAFLTITAFYLFLSVIFYFNHSYPRALAKALFRKLNF
ncbi:MAG: glycosyltransferase family 39 protein [Candidatus Omnitrophica bacterium]|nr:glycosyltransferase family 39 protein [Candidatus Omnitrophota bacterium]